MKSSEPGSVVSFRLTPTFAKRLADNAGRVGMSTGAYARLLLIEVLSDTQSVRLLDELSTIRKSLGTLQHNLETAVVAILTDAGKAALSEAQAFVREQMTR